MFLKNTLPTEDKQVFLTNNVIMFGFLEKDGFAPGDSDKLGSKGRFAKRIEKFRLRNEMEKISWEYYRDRIARYPEVKKEWEEQQRAIANGEEVKGKQLRREPIEPKIPLAPTMRFIHPIIEHHFWWLTHNIIAHTLIGLIPIKLFFDFHDWTSKKLNAK